MRNRETNSLAEAPADCRLLTARSAARLRHVADDSDQGLRTAAEMLARILDTMIPIPGTRWRIGVDPLVGLLPGIGDAIASLVGSTILLMAARAGVPRIVLARMSLNLLINGTIGAIPVIGDLFSIWFRSNVRNVDLLVRAADRTRSTAPDWAFVIGIVIASLVLIGLVAFSVIRLLAAIWQRVA